MTIRFDREIAAAAATHHLDPRLLAAVAAQETGGPGSDSGRNIVGDGGHGRGVFQIDDRFWAFARTAAAMDPRKNAQMAASILGDNLRRFGGNVRRALSAYNAGSPDATGTTTRWGDGRVLGYADSVLRHYDALGGSHAQLAADVRGTLRAVDPLASARAAAIGNDPHIVDGFAASAWEARATLERLNAPYGVFASYGAMPAPPTPPSVSSAPPDDQGTREGGAADAMLADLVDSGDVFAVPAKS